MAAAGGQGRAEAPSELVYSTLGSLQLLPQVVALVEKDLSEPYSVYTYRYFVVGWPELALVAMSGETLVGVIICKADRANRRQRFRGYIAMLAVESSFRKRGIGSELVKRAIAKMREIGCDEVVLETEYSNKTALEFYERQGFVRSKRMVRYYLNGGDAFRLKLWFTSPSWADPETLPDINSEAPPAVLMPSVDEALAQVNDGNEARVLDSKRVEEQRQE